MEGISDLRIVGIDERRPPVIRKEPYIDIFFKLSHEAPPDWCNILNSLMKQNLNVPKIKIDEGLYIESWVRSPDEIVAFVAQLKESVAECTRQYIEEIEKALHSSDAASQSLAEEAGEQGRLNRIIASLDFDEVPE